MYFDGHVNNAKIVRDARMKGVSRPRIMGNQTNRSGIDAGPDRPKVEVSDPIFTLFQRLFQTVA